MDFTGLDFGTVAPSTLVAMGILAIFRGWLVPRRVLDALVKASADRVSDAGERVTSADKTAAEWKDAYLAEAKINDVQARQITQLLDASRATQAVIAAIPKAMGND